MVSDFQSFLENDIRNKRWNKFQEEIKNSVELSFKNQDLNLHGMVELVEFVDVWKIRKL